MQSTCKPSYSSLFKIFKINHILMWNIYNGKFDIWEIIWFPILCIIKLYLFPHRQDWNENRKLFSYCTEEYYKEYTTCAVLVSILWFRFIGHSSFFFLTWFSFMLFIYSVGFGAFIRIQWSLKLGVLLSYRAKFGSWSIQL